MIGVKIQGRLGNQLFQIAFASVLAKRLNTGYYLCRKPWRGVMALNYFDVAGLNRFSFLLKFLIGHFLRILGILKPVEISNDISVEKQSALFTNNAYYIGFFQSEKYYTGYEKYVQELFTIKVKYQQLFESSMGEFMRRKKNIAVHIRRGDYLNQEGENISLSLTYYKKSLAQIADLQNYNVIFVSDDIEWVKQQFTEFPDALFCSNHFMVDLQILMHADILVLANSSFSWWGAYLNKKNAVVYAPYYWLGNKDKGTSPKDILCHNWIGIDAN